MLAVNLLCYEADAFCVFHKRLTQNLALLFLATS